MPGTRADTEDTVRKTTQSSMLTGGKGFNMNLPAHLKCAGRGVNNQTAEAAGCSTCWGRDEVQLDEVFLPLLQLF